jgi:RES domain-containing protein
MIQAWRIVQTQRASTAFGGEGARLYGGRWNRPGTRAIYCSGSLSLATLEILVNLDSGQSLGRYVSIPVAFDDSICEKLEFSALPKDWSTNPPPSSTQSLGSEWAASQTSAILAVPSSVIHTELNYIMNPAHPHFTSLVIGDASPFDLDDDTGFAQDVTFA